MWEPIGTFAPLLFPHLTLSDFVWSMSTSTGHLDIKALYLEMEQSYRPYVIIKH